MKDLYLILVSICFILFGIASFFIVESSSWVIFEIFVIISPIVGITVAIISFIRFIKHKCE